MGRKLASILVGDHLGQVKKVSWPSGEVSLLPDFDEPNSSNPIVSIEPLSSDGTKHLISTKNGNLFIHDSVHGKTKNCNSDGKDALIRAVPLDGKDIVFVHEKFLLFDYANKSGYLELKLKKGRIRDARVCDGKIAVVGEDIPLRVFDARTRNKIFDADPPEKDWLGIQPECHVASLDFVGPHRIATCSKSDSVIRVYDINSSKSCPIISIELNHTAFNEYAEAGRFLSIASSTGEVASTTSTIVVGSNVGQLIAIELRFNIKQQPKKRLQPRTHKILGGFRGSRGATIKDTCIFKAEPEEAGAEFRIISCCLDRYLRIYNMSKATGRHLDKQVYMKTKPMCCSPVFYEKC